MGRRLARIRGGITNARWENLYGGDGFWAFADPTDPERRLLPSRRAATSAASIARRTASRDIQPKAGYKEKLRFNWNTPIHASPTQKGTIYIGAQFLFRSRDRGDTWERISPDLTTNDPEKQKQEESGGVTVDNSSAEMHTTIYSISESPKNAERDLGRHRRRQPAAHARRRQDAGRTSSATCPALPKSSWVSWVEASRFDAGTAYAAFDRHTFGDMTPWVYRTTDFGKTWTRIVAPEQGVRGYAHVIKEDTVKKDLLFLGTEFGLWISHRRRRDVGASSRAATSRASRCATSQVHPRDNDLVIATHGRGIWIIDDITPLRALTDATLAEADRVPARRARCSSACRRSGGWVEGDAAFVGENPPSGAVITYYQRTRHLFGPIKLEMLDAERQARSTRSRRASAAASTAWRGPCASSRRACRAPRRSRSAASQGPRVVPGHVHACG